ncbi:MAG: hypothetical protein IJ757_03225 [Clostridiales bacterium]|nr:hypothetical protein [Clostridiales bacterium]
MTGKKNSRFKECLKYIVVIAIAVIIAFPHLIMTTYAIPGADDFSCANAVSIYRENHNMVASAIAYTRDVYYTWQGTYTGEFIMGMEPSVRESFTAIRVILFLSVVLFAASLIMLVYIICKRFFGLSSSKAIAVSLLAEFTAFNISVTGELFSWYTGMAVYTIPLIAVLFCLAFSIISYYDGKLIYAILASVFGVIGAGGSLEVVGFGCMALLVLLVVYTMGIKNIKANIRRLIFLYVPFVLTVAGALFNTLAPGNFVRQESMTNSGSFKTALITSFLNFNTHVSFILTTYILPLVLLVVFIICICSDSKISIDGSKLVLAVIGAVVIPVVTIFPVILGYGSYNVDAYISSSRVIYIFDLVISLSLIILDGILALYLKELLRRNNINAKEQMHKYLILVIALLLVFSGNVVQNYNNGMSGRISEDIKGERMHIVSERFTDVYRQINEAEDGTDVYIVMPDDLPDTELYVPLYIEQPEYFANKEVATYYNVNSFTRLWG